MFVHTLLFNLLLGVCSSLLFTHTISLFNPLLLLLLLDSKVSHMLLVDVRLFVKGSILVGEEALLVGAPWIVLKLRHRWKITAGLARLEPVDWSVISKLTSTCFDCRTGRTDIQALELLKQDSFRLTRMMVIRTGSHLSDDLRALVDTNRSIVDGITEVLHTTDAIEHVVSRVNAASHSVCDSLTRHRASTDLNRVVVRRVHLSLSYLSTGSISHSLRHGRFLGSRETFTDGARVTRRWSDLSWRK